jgi:endonuclease/exonuclease/phosphatase (EEP) superfamily protein YafD
MRVLVWNVLKGRRPGWGDEFAELARDRHLVLLQEAWLREGAEADAPMRATLTGCEGLAWQMVVSWVDAGGGGFSTGVATGAAARPTTMTPLVSPETEPVIDTPKTALVTTYPLEGSDAPLLVANIHALNFVSAETLSLHLDQLEEEIAGHVGPVLFAGDFNAWTDDKQARVRAMTGRLGLTELSFDGHSEDSDARTRVFGNPLDYAFVRGLEVTGARVHETQRSDHNGLLLELAVPAP